MTGSKKKRTKKIAIKKIVKKRVKPKIAIEHLPPKVLPQIATTPQMYPRKRVLIETAPGVPLEGQIYQTIQNIHQRIAASNRGNELRQQTTTLRQSIADIDREERANRDLAEELVLLKKNDKDLMKKIIELKPSCNLHRLRNRS